MKKVAIFTEGQGEQIFVRQLLYQVMGYESISFECMELHAKNLYQVRYPYSTPNPAVHYLIVNIGNDETVLTAISERQENLVSKGYELIIGLRDMYSEAYRKRSSNINESVTQSFINAHNTTIQQMRHADKIRIFFAIMELESWLLSMYKLVEKFNPLLNCEHIESKLGFNLSRINPETEFFHPSNNFKDILALVGERYNKSRDQMESILSNMIQEDIDDALEESRCSKSFELFLWAILA